MNRATRAAYAAMGSLCMLAGVCRAAVAQESADSDNVRGLPIVEVPTSSTCHVFAVLLSGDGGWADIDKQIAAEMARRGVPVLGFDLRTYLGKERTPAETSIDVARTVRAYRQKWKCDRVAIVGFSRGANIAPFAVARFPETLQKDIELVGLIGLAPAANFKWHWQDLVRDVKRSSDLPVRPELEHIASIRTVCIFGADEKESGCRDTPPGVTRVERAGGHHQDGDYKAVADILIDAIKP